LEGSIANPKNKCIPTNSVRAEPLEVLANP
jgi:hypothetical protein